MSCFSGQLSNLEELSAHCDLGADRSLKQAGMRAARVLLQLYLQLGQDCVAIMEGSFACCVFAEEELLAFVSNSASRLLVTGFLPKSEMSQALASTTSSASTYATPPGEDDSCGTGSSLQEPSGSYKKTRRGKRAGKNLRLRNAESQLRRSISDLRHGNDPQRIPSFASQMNRVPASPPFRTQQRLPQHHSMPIRGSNYSSAQVDLRPLTRASPPADSFIRGRQSLDGSIPASPLLVPHDGKADAAWGEQDSSAGTSGETRQRAAPITPRQKQPGFHVLHSLTEEAFEPLQQAPRDSPGPFTPEQLSSDLGMIREESRSLRADSTGGSYGNALEAAEIQHMLARMQLHKQGTETAAAK
ncbi:hypothetical protein WJX73_004927 [Symbiochloris irregularis]|uniref:Uncharacterized protein n=1 Tax=Symbiochloris irregularis TaxID=706552 RepID=A0AAW1P2N4_9CHLO